MQGMTHFRLDPEIENAVNIIGWLWKLNKLCRLGNITVSTYSGLKICLQIIFLPPWLWIGFSLSQQTEAEVMLELPTLD